MTTDSYIVIYSKSFTDRNGKVHRRKDGGFYRFKVPNKRKKK
ncbi:hypothetical protein C882_3030 [Caenispirillum salinarum AK4]|uniref:Uncharacterized protein n=1 Tax=Caenispirillum salinarum AK4 TaxID=1238182 RepID=K9HUN1_9PROT|nr:hypothetical protein [Caenispirillum salinarum]EKV31966.1 hypothetical protein C882_3030 [Caenispirillum salinarum AK4]